MARYQIILAYDGTEFLGFQRQGQGRTVQAVVEAALRQIGWRGESILAAGRTDTGVHAIGQVIAFDFDWKHSTTDLMHALNANLPQDVSALMVSEVTAEFHPRYDASDRTYQYRLYIQAERHPLRDRYAWRVHPLDQPEALQPAAEIFLGTQDFRWLQLPLKETDNPVREVQISRWFQVEDEQRFEIRANAFLYHMVRRIVYLCVLAGQGKLDIQTLQRASHEGGDLPPGMAPAQGLSLVEVRYLPYDRRKKIIPQDCGTSED
jgi:tRNA pseudouridine38-40 synthase